MPPEKLHWKHLFDEVVTSGLCTGCAGCVVACPHDVLGYKDTEDVYKPFHLEEELGPGGCGHGDRGCTSCTRACPRFRTWEPEIDQFLFGRPRSAIEVEGVTKDVILTRASDAKVHELGQDGGLVSAILIWALDHGYIDSALVSYLEGDGSTWKAIPGVARTREEILAAAGSRYTYCAAEHADISTGGIGKFNDWTLTVIRTDLGREIIVKMLEDGTIEGRPGDDDPGAIALMRKLSVKSRKRWPEFAVPEPKLIDA